MIKLYIKVKKQNYGCHSLGVIECLTCGKHAICCEVHKDEKLCPCAQKNKSCHLCFRAKKKKRNNKNLQSNGSPFAYQLLLILLTGQL